jgi:hypothetical protein
MDFGLQCVLEKHREACEALADRFYQNNDDAGIALLDEILEYEFMALRVLNDAYGEVIRKIKENV